MQYFKYYISLTLFFLYFQCFSIQFYDSKSVEYVFSKDVSEYREEVEITGNGIGKLEIYIPYGELEKVISIKGYIVLSNRTITLDKSMFNSKQVLTGAFYDGYKEYVYVKDFKNESFKYKISYTVKHSEVLITPKLLLGSEKDGFKKFNYVIKFPKEHFILYKIFGDTSAIEVDIKEESGKIILQSQNKEGVVLENNFPILGYQIYPQEYKEKELLYLKGRYLEYINEKNKISQFSYEEIINVSNDVEDSLKKVEIIFNHIRQKVRYVDIENGMNGYVPREVNSIWLNKYGDCKDMANLMCSVLQKMGYGVSLALSSTINTKADMDFPAYSSANHVICVMKYKNQIYYLDATDEHSPFGLPSIHTQGKHIVVLDELPYTHYIKPVEPEKNHEIYSLNLKIKNDTITSKMYFLYTGYSSNFFRKANTMKDASFNKIIKDYLTELTGYKNLDSINYHFKSDTFVLSAISKTAVQTFVVGDKIYYKNIKFINPMKGYLIVDTLTSKEVNFLHTINIKVSYDILFDKSVSIISHSDQKSGENMAFSYNQTLYNSNDLKVYYDFYMPHKSIKDKSKKDFINIYDTFKKNIDRSIYTTN